MIIITAQLTTSHLLFRFNIFHDTQQIEYKFFNTVMTQEQATIFTFFSAQ